MRYNPFILLISISLLFSACESEDQRFIKKIHKQLEGNWQITEIHITLPDTRDSITTDDLGTLRFPHCEDYQAADCVIERVLPDGKKIEGIYFAFSDKPEGNGQSLNLSLFTGTDNSAEQWVGPFTIEALDKDLLHISTQGTTALANNGVGMDIYASRIE
ncbi:MAG: hypothetical protein SF052_05465 [Bacteroidia bacterium]|nr:hypothetical protein [Bacteroidia bacterium]